jgi:hypothetical protein
MDIKNTKILLNSKKEILIAQDMLHKLGVNWNRNMITGEFTPITKSLRGNEIRQLYIDNSLNLTHMEINREEYFRENINREIKLIPDTKLARKLYKKIIAEKEGYLLIST